MESLPHYFETILEDSLALLQQMVGINSFTENAVGVNALGRLTAEAFSPLGFEAEFVPSEDPRYGEHLVLTKRGRSPRTVGMVSHLDTVFPPEEELANDFRWREEVAAGERRIYGPGTVDIKGGTVMMHMVLSAVRHFAPELFEDTTWVLLLDAAEENLCPDFEDLCASRLLPQHTLACLVFEGGIVRGTRFNLVVARKGMARYKIFTEGRASHAGAAHPQGANAVLQMAEVAQKIESYTDYERELTFNLGVFQGGTVVNRVPHAAFAEVEFRTFETAVFADALGKMAALDGYSSVRSPADGFACTTRVEKTIEVQPWPSNAGSQRLFEVWTAAAEELGWETNPERRGGLSDGNRIWHLVPTMDGLGPAGGNSHASERSADGSKVPEYVLPDSFVPKATLNAQALMRLLDEADSA